MAPQHRTNSGIPSLPPALTTLLGALFVLYAAELAVQSVGRVNLNSLLWKPFGLGFHPYQLVSRYFIQGPAVLNVFIELIVLAFFAPTLMRALPTRKLAQAMLATAAGGTLLGLLVDVTGLTGGYANGWSVFVAAGIALFGLLQPEATILLFFVLPVPAKLLTWGTLAMALLNFLATPSLAAADYLGSILGLIAWWYGVGPGARRRPATRPRGSKGGFHVLQGGRNRGDDMIH